MGRLHHYCTIIFNLLSASLTIFLLTVRLSLLSLHLCDIISNLLLRSSTTRFCKIQEQSLISVRARHCNQLNTVTNMTNIHSSCDSNFCCWQSWNCDWIYSNMSKMMVNVTKILILPNFEPWVYMNQNPLLLVAHYTFWHPFQNFTTWTCLLWYKSNLGISNSVDSNSQLFWSQADSPSFDHHLALTQLFWNPTILNLFSHPGGLQNSGVRL